MARMPHKILCAQAVVDADPVFAGLSPATRSVLRAILYYTSASDPLSACFAHKETLAGQAHVTEVTVYRSINVLITEGLIERLEQERKNLNGRYAVARLRLTRKCCILVGLLNSGIDGNDKNAAEDNLHEVNNNSVNNENSENNIHATGRFVCRAANPSKATGKGASEPDAITLTEMPIEIEQALPASPNTHMLDGHINNQPKADQRVQSRRDNRSFRGTHRPVQGKPVVRIPSEFSWLVDSGRLTPPAVCKLMRLFSTRGQRMSDAVFVTKRHLLGIPKRSVYAYLAKLARLETDFAAQAKAIREIAMDKRKDAEKKQVATSLSEMSGRWLVYEDRTRLFKLAGGHAEVFTLVGGIVQRASATINQLADAYAKGRITEIEPEDAEALRRQWSKLN